MAVDRAYTWPMTYKQFMTSVAEDATPPEGLDARLQALWYAAKGQWEKAHTVAQGIETASGSWIHAHLHREEGDLSNAGYWYARAGRPPTRESLDEERAALIRTFLENAADGA